MKPFGEAWAEALPLRLLQVRLSAARCLGSPAARKPRPRS
jgi:hypothetical protein